MNKTIVLTGADGGLGNIFIRQLLKKMPEVEIIGIGLHPHPDDFIKSIDATRYQYYLIDITKEREVAQLAHQIPSVDWLVNCAGVELKLSFESAQTIMAAHLEMSVNFLGANIISHHFYKPLKSTPQSKLINIISIAGLVPIVDLGAYSASKAAVHVLTLCQRKMLRKFGITVHGVYPGWLNVGMGVGVESEEMASPDTVVERIIDGILNGDESIFPDSMSQRILRENPHLLKFPTL
ncbi:MAG: SDR family NAD(P)-dependent oxidoreductase [Marinagarivorans sp.]